MITGCVQKCKWSQRHIDAHCGPELPSAWVTGSCIASSLPIISPWSILLVFCLYFACILLVFCSYFACILHVFSLYFPQLGWLAHALHHHYQSSVLGVFCLYFARILLVFCLYLAHIFLSMGDWPMHCIIITNIISPWSILLVFCLYFVCILLYFVHIFFHYQSSVLGIFC